MANLKNTEKKTKAQAMGMHTEVLTGRTQQKFFNPDEAENFYYFGTYDVDFNKRTDLDVLNMTAAEANKEIDNLMSQGFGTIVIKNPQGKHSLGVGILNKLNLIFEGSLGYFGVGSIDGPIVRVNGRVGWSCAENMMAGKVVIEKNAGSCFGAAIRGGDLICKGSVGARTGIDQKGGTIIIGGDAGAFTGFMMQRGRIIILGDVGINLGDSMYDGTIYVGGKIGSFGSDAVESPMTKSDIDWIKRKLKVAEIGEDFNISNMTKVVAGKKLWNYDALEPTEKKGAI
jgi:glutamate synthase domain-containing protein 3